jgi:integrase
MSISQLPSGSWRTQLRQKHYPRFDEVHPTRDAAEAAEAAELARRRGTETAGPRMPLRDAIARYSTSTALLDRRPATIRSYTRALAEVSAALGEYSLDHLARNVSLITDYRDKRRNSISPRTGKKLGKDAVRIELSALSQVFAWTIETKLFTHNPLTGVKRARGPVTRRRLEPDESVNLKLLAERAKLPQHRTIARFLLIQLELYCRPGELSNLLKADVRLADRDCILRDTKNGETRTVYISSAAADLIAAQLVEAEVAGSPYLFHTLNKNGEFMPYNYAWPIRQLKKLKYLGSSFKAHVVRKEAISRGLESHVELATIQMQSGHRTFQGIENYRVNLSMSDESREKLEISSAKHLLEADADVNNQLPPKLSLARARHLFAALPPEVQKEFLALQEAASAK